MTNSRLVRSVGLIIMSHPSSYSWQCLDARNPHVLSFKGSWWSSLPVTNRLNVGWLKMILKMNRCWSKMDRKCIPWPLFCGKKHFLRCTWPKAWLQMFKAVCEMQKKWTNIGQLLLANKDLSMTFMGLSENVVYPQTQWFCWSLSLWKMAISLGILTQHFQTNPYGLL